jgi:transglutaminase-like putative cysteine protease
MNRTILVFLAGALGCVGTGGLLAQPGAPSPAAAKMRSFEFTYAGRVTDLKPGTSARVWLPLAVSNGQQDVSVAAQQIPGDAQIAKDKGYGNSILYFESKANDKGEIPFEVIYKVKRKEVKTDIKGNLHVQVAPGEKVERYLQPDAKVPVAGKPLELLQETLKGNELPKNQFAAAKVLYDVVNKHMTYKKVGTGWGQGDSLWACDSKYGNCTDFHSLFISMARGSKIASKFEMGFPVPRKRGAGALPGYHCWAWFLPEGKGWIPVDISEANQHPELTEYYFGNLSENRVSFSVGRDIDLEPRQKGPPLNFFIYPYVEVDGKALPAEKVVRAFSYKDLP